MAKVKTSEIIEKAAERGDPIAQFELALGFEYGDRGEQNFDKAGEWYRKDAVQGHQTAKFNNTFLAKPTFISPGAMITGNTVP